MPIEKGRTERSTFSVSPEVMRDLRLTAASLGGSVADHVNKALVRYLKDKARTSMKGILKPETYPDEKV